jgi:CHU_C Type IX secretion signal domain
MKNLYNALVLWALAAVGLSAQAPHSSPNTARELCNKAPVTVTNVAIGGGGGVPPPTCFFTPIRRPYWFRFTPVTSGDFEFVVIPEVAITDYDFALYLGNPLAGGTELECDYASPFLPTGITPDPGAYEVPNNISIVPTSIFLNAGVEYYLLVDNYSQNQVGFTILFGGSVGIGSTDVPGVLDARSCGTAPLFDCACLSGFESGTEQNFYASYGAIPTFGAQADNPHVYRFRACACAMRFTVTITGACATGFGLEAQVLTASGGTCAGPPLTVVDEGVPGSPCQVTAYDLTVGQEYVLVVDGQFGASCPYRVDIQEINPPPLVYQDTILTVEQHYCEGDTIAFLLPQTQNVATCYWVPPPGFDTLQSSHDTLFLVVPEADTLPEVCLVLSNGCHQTVTICRTIIVHPDTTVELSVGLCPGDLPYQFGNQTLTAFGTYTDSLQTTTGCDSVVVLTLFESPICPPLCSPSSDPNFAASDACADAPLLCGNYLDNFCTNNFGATGLLADAWLRIAPCDDSVTIAVTVSNCAQTQGLTFALGDGTCANLLPIGTPISVAANSVGTLFWTGLEPDSVYFLQILGINGDQCQVQFDVLSGISTAPPVDCNCTPNTIEGPTDLCPGDVATYTLNPGFCLPTILPGACVPPAACPPSGGGPLIPVWHFSSPSISFVNGDSVGYSVDIVVDQNLQNSDTLINGEVWITWENPNNPAPVDSLIFCDCPGGCLPTGPAPKPFQIRHIIRYETCFISCSNPACFANGDVYTTPGVYVNDADNCETIITFVQANFTPPNSGPLTTVTICQGESTTLSAPPQFGPVAYNWSNGPGTPTITVSPPVGTHTYTVTMTHLLSGCTATAVRRVIVLPTKITNLTYQLCPVGSVSACGETFTSVGSFSVVCQSYQGCDSIINLTILPGQPQIVNQGTIGVLTCAQTVITHLGQAYTTPGSYTRLIGCTQYNFTIAADQSLPAVTISASATQLCEGQSASLQAQPVGGVYGYAWSPAALNQASITVTPPVGNTTYRVTVTNLANGCTGSASRNISVLPYTTTQLGTVGYVTCAAPCFSFLNKNYCAAGTYADTTGCDISIFSIQFQYDTIQNGLIGTLTCQQPCLTFLGQQYCAVGTYVVTDSCAVQVFSIGEDLTLPVVTLPADTLCAGECATFFGQQICTSTTATHVENCVEYTQTFVVLPYTITQLGTVGYVTCAAPCFSFLNKNYCTPGIYADTTGCDISIFSIQFQYDTIQNGLVGTLTCQQPCLTFLGQQYCAVGTYVVTDSCAVQVFSIGEDLTLPVVTLPADTLCAGACASFFGQQICTSTTATYVENCVEYTQTFVVLPYTTTQLGTVGYVTCATPCFPFLNKNYCTPGIYADTSGCDISIFSIQFQYDTIQNGLVGTLTCQQPCLTFLGQQYCAAGTYVVTDSCAVQVFSIGEDLSSPTCSAPYENCLPSNTHFTVSFSITGQPPFKVNGQTIGGSNYLSAPQPNGSTYNFIVEQAANGCQTLVSGTFDCASMCATDAGVLDPAPLRACAGQGSVQVVSLAAPSIPTGYLSEFWLRNAGGATLLRNTTGQFEFDATLLQTGVGYRVVRVVGPPAPSGGADDTHVCSRLAEGPTVIFDALPTAVFDGTSVACPNDLVQLTASGGNAYAWADGTSGHHFESVTPATPQVLTYTVTISDAQGCTATGSTSVQVVAAPRVAMIDALPPLCPDDANGTLEIVSSAGGLPPYAYALDGGAFGASGLFENLTAGTYTLAIRDAHGCGSDTSVTLHAPLPMALDLGPDLSVVQGTWVTLQANTNIPAASVTWVAQPSGLTATDGLEWVLQIVQPTAVECTVTNANGCVVTDRVFIAQESSGRITHPNVIWLGDAQQVENQYFTIFSNPGWITDIESLTIFDRWGNAVWQRHNFAANTPTEGWDGQQNGRPVDPAVFVFIAEVSLADGTKTILRGDVTVVR